MSRALLGSVALFLLTSCGYLAEDPQQLAEREFLQKDQQVADVINQIREKGLDAVVASAESGSVAACVASRLAADPLGKLVSVEGALAEGARITQLLADLQQMLETEPSLADLGKVLEQGAAAARYASQLIREQGFDGALATIKQMATANIGDNGLGQHFQLLVASCQNYDKTTPTASGNQT
jgi:hypothetical protein